MKELVLRNIEALSQNGEIFCVEVAVIYTYKDGHYTDEIEGVRYSLVFPSMQYQRVEVRTKEIAPNPEVLDTLSENQSCIVEVEGFRARISVDFIRKELRLSCTADTVYPTDESEVLIS